MRNFLSKKMARALNFLFPALFLALSFSFAAAQNQPAKVYLQSSSERPGVLAMEVVVDSEEPLNAFSISIEYPINILYPVSIDIGSSIADIWKFGRPYIDQKNNIRLEGGLTSPFSGEAGVLATIFFEVRSSGSGKIRFAQADLLKADGLGTPLTVLAQNTPIEALSVLLDSESSFASENTFSSPSLEKLSTLNLADYNFSIAKDPIGKNYLISFTAGAGDTLFSRLRHRRWLSWSDGQLAVSPALVPRGSWQAELEIVFDGEPIGRKRILIKSELAKKLGIVFLFGVAAGLFFRRKNRVI